MQTYIVSLLNAAILIVLSLWGYFGSDSPSLTALIPTIAGVALLICSPGVKRQNKIIAHIAVTITLIIGIGLITPLMGAFGRNDTGAIFRILLMILSTVLALGYFIKSFIEARRQKEA
jgi:uncharacterized RDD family membrane protein YckC